MIHSSPVFAMDTVAKPALTMAVRVDHLLSAEFFGQSVKPLRSSRILVGG